MATLEIEIEIEICDWKTMVERLSLDRKEEIRASGKPECLPEPSFYQCLICNGKNTRCEDYNTSIFSEDN